MSWNVLADSYGRGEYDPRTDSALLRPRARGPALFAALETAGSDLFCLQEIEPYLITEARARLSGWTIHAAYKRDKLDGCAILARHGIALDEVEAFAYADGVPSAATPSDHVPITAEVRFPT